MKGDGGLDEFHVDVVEIADAELCLSESVRSEFVANAHAPPEVVASGPVLSRHGGADFGHLLEREPTHEELQGEWPQRVRACGAKVSRSLRLGVIDHGSAEEATEEGANHAAFAFW
jgi:hypothetical protein